MSKYMEIRDQMKEAMKAKDSVKLDVIRGLVTAFTNENVFQKRGLNEELSDEEVLSIISKAVKQRKDSIKSFEEGDRPDLAEVEKAELEILESYLPPQMSRDEIVDIVKKKQEETGVDKAKAGQFMGIVMKDLKGKADSAVVKNVIDELLT